MTVRVALPTRKGKSVSSHKEVDLLNRQLQYDLSFIPSSPSPSSDLAPSSSQEPISPSSKDSQDLPVDSFFSAGDPNGKERYLSNNFESTYKPMCSLRGDGTVDGPLFSVFDAVPK